MFGKWLKENVLKMNTPLQYFGNTLRVLTFILFCLFVVVVVGSFIILKKILVLTQKREFFSCATIALSERHHCGRNLIINGKVARSCNLSYQVRMEIIVKLSVRILSFYTKTRTQHLSNVIREYYRYNNVHESSQACGSAGQDT